MTDLSRGARSGRGGRGPGSLLLTGLLVLAIVASSTLVFTNKVELLRLAVVLSLWAAVLAAFVTVIYRRQSEVAQARARDMKFVYDLQLDREISARREYELSVEARIRRQMSREGTQAAEEMAALRAELVSLRSQLEVMLGADLAPRPALESDRFAVPMPAAPGRVESSRVTVVAEEVLTVTEETVDEIIDVPEEPLAPEPAAPPVQARVVEYPSRRRPPPRPVPPVEQYAPPRPPQPETPWRPPEVRLGRHSNAADAGQPWRPEPTPERTPEPEPEPTPGPGPERGRHWVPPEPPPAPAGRHRGSAEDVAPPPVREPSVEEAAEPEGQHAAGQSIADLLSKFNVTRPVGGGGRRRRDD